MAMVDFLDDLDGMLEECGEVELRPTIRIQGRVRAAKENGADVLVGEVVVSHKDAQGVIREALLPAGTHLARGYPHLNEAEAKVDKIAEVAREAAKKRGYLVAKGRWR